LSTQAPKKLRALFCIAVTQNFFDLPASGIPAVWKAVGEMLSGIAKTPGIQVLGTLDDDETMVGTSPSGWPWTCYVLAEADHRDAIVAACNLFRVTPVGEHRLWKFLRVEARIGRELVVPN